MAAQMFLETIEVSLGRGDELCQPTLCVGLADRSLVSQARFLLILYGVEVLITLETVFVRVVSSAWRWKDPVCSHDVRRDCAPLVVYFVNAAREGM